MYKYYSIIIVILKILEQKIFCSTGILFLFIYKLKNSNVSILCFIIQYCTIIELNVYFIEQKYIFYPIFDKKIKIRFVVIINKLI